MCVARVCVRVHTPDATPPTCATHRFGACARVAEPAARVIVILLVVWAILAVVGFALEGLLWLGIIGVILFLGTLIFFFVRRAASRRSKGA